MNPLKTLAMSQSARFFNGRKQSLWAIVRQAASLDDSVRCLQTLLPNHRTIDAQVVEELLDELKHAGLVPAGIITAPDRPKGRGLAIAPSRVKTWARENKILVLQPEELEIDADVFVVASYGVILSKDILALPRHGTLNVHPSLLPKYRGATPIESQILAEEKEIGVSIMVMDEEMDHGAILAQKRVENTKIQKARELRIILAEIGGKLLAEVMQKWVEGKIEAKPQDDSQATYTKKLAKSDGEINLSDNPYKNFLKIRAFDGGIGTYFSVNGTRIVIKDADFVGDKLTITRVVPEGKREMSYEEFLRGVK